MRMTLAAAAAVASLGLAAPVQASVAYQWIDRGVPANGAVVATGYRAWVLELTSNSGNITAVDFTGTGNKGIFAPLHQR